MFAELPESWPASGSALTPSFSAQVEAFKCCRWERIKHRAKSAQCKNMQIEFLNKRLLHL